jgi:hypothetical protein
MPAGISPKAPGLPLVHVELVAETNTEVTGNHRYELVGGMVMGWDFVVGRHF